MSPTTHQTTTAQGNTTPMKSNPDKSPKTPSPTPRDNFDLTPNTQTTHSFADSGFFSAADGTYGAVTGYKDWILFPDVEDGGQEIEFLDTSGFFRDADEVMNYSDHADKTTSPDSSLELPPLNPHNPIYDHELRSLTQSLQSHTISSPPPPPPPSQSPRVADFTRIGNEKEDISMLEIWQQSQERHEYLAYQFEQPPYTQREHLLPVFRQSSRVRRRSGNARRNHAHRRPSVGM